MALPNNLITGAAAVAPASLFKEMIGATAFSNPPTLPATTLIGGVPMDGATAPLAIAAATTTLTLSPATHGNRWLNIASTGGLAVTPPAATGTGNWYGFFASAAISGGNFTLDAKAGNASDVFAGIIQSYKATTVTPYPTASNSNLLTFDGSTMGFAAAGDWFRIQDLATNLWKIEGWTVQSGTIASMFSHH